MEEDSRNLSYTGRCQLNYWHNFTKYVEAIHPEATFKFDKPIPRHWCILRIGSPLGWVSAEINSKTKEISVRFTLKSNDAAKSIFDELYASGYQKSKDVISPEIEWRRLNHRKTCVIILLTEGDFTNRIDWNRQFEWIYQTCLRFYNFFKPLMVNFKY